MSQHPFLRGLRAPLHISHRGGAALYPENTMLAFKSAVEKHQTDMLELDIHATKDGVVVVAHDDTLDRCTNGQGPLAALTYAELIKLDAGKGERIPRFEDVLAAFPSMRMNVELKVTGVLEPFVALMKKTGALDRLCIGSAVDSIAQDIAKALPTALLFYPTDALAAFVLPTKAGEPPDDDGRYTVLDMPLHWEGVKLFDAELAKLCAERGKWVNIWTVDDPAEMRAAIAEGVGGIMTDRPDLLREVINATK
ncbi:MAG: glycerophosphodiester phosphodiesterase [Archangium sp.]|nr:glycerophosphodiester phosphodiesterase [Archangium sp.]